MTPQTAAVMQPVKGSVPVRQGSIDLFDEVGKVYDSIARRAFEIFETDGHSPGRELEHWLRAESELLQPLPVNLTETDSSYIVQAEVPGFGSRDLEIEVEPSRLAISGKHETKQDETKEKTICSEWRADQILRTLELPADVDTSKVSAALKDGILTVALPKAQHAKKVKIEPKAA
jgi:HSP20 family protein